MFVRDSLTEQVGLSGTCWLNRFVRDLLTKQVCQGLVDQTSLSGTCWLNRFVRDVLTEQVCLSGTCWPNRFVCQGLVDWTGLFVRDLLTERVRLSGTCWPNRFVLFVRDLLTKEVQRMDSIDRYTLFISGSPCMSWALCATCWTFFMATCWCCWWWRTTCGWPLLLLLVCHHSCFLLWISFFLSLQPPPPPQNVFLISCPKLSLSFQVPFFSLKKTHFWTALSVLNAVQPHEEMFSCFRLLNFQVYFSPLHPSSSTILHCVWWHSKPQTVSSGLMQT